MRVQPSTCHCIVVPMVLVSSAPRWGSAGMRAGAVNETCMIRREFEGQTQDANQSRKGDAVEVVHSPKANAM